MKILTTNLKWIDVTFNAKTGNITQGLRGYTETEILAIKDDDRNNYYKCKHCGEYVPKDKKEEHLSRFGDITQCFNCYYKYIASAENRIIDYTQNEDGTYTEAITQKVKLLCRRGYPNKPIPSPDCKYACKEDDLVEFSNFFMTFPDAFNQLITVDALVDAGWICDVNMMHEMRFICPDENLKLSARVTKHGVVSCFYCFYRTHTYNFSYSIKYNKIFFRLNGRYSDDNERISDARINRLTREIQKLI